MNYVPVVAGTNSTNLSGTKDAASQEVKKDVSSLRFIALPNWDHDALLESSSSKPQDDCSADVPESSGNSNLTATSTNPPADQIETLTVETPIHTVSSPVLTACFTGSKEPSNILRVATNSDESNGVEADVSNMETTITAGPTPILRIHKDHLKSQIIGPVDTPIQTRNKSKEIIFVKDSKSNKLRALQLFPSFPYQQCDFLCYQWGIIPVNSRSMIGSLMYLTASRPGIMFDVCACARHQVIPKECHLHAVKRIFRYLKGHPKLGLWYPKESPFDLVAYSDSDYGGATQDCKSTAGGCQFFGRRLILWQCTKQTIMATSTTEAEYVASASCCGHVLWIQNQLLDYGLSISCEALSKEISSFILL
nr:uncharacterized mitochondrial protein AtMg00810-like [Tanacetum cinerariifolium]